MVSVDEIVAAVLRAVEESRRAKGNNRGGHRKFLDDRHLKLEEVHGKAEDWSDWSFSFKRAIKSLSKEAWRIMGEVERADKDAMETMNLSTARSLVRRGVRLVVSSQPWGGTSGGA